MRIFFLRASFISAFLAVALGAFAAHLLETMIEPSRVAIFNTGVRYQFYHSLALAITAISGPLIASKWSTRAGWLFVGGIVLFSGSLYLLALRDVLAIAHWKWLGPLTPIGGLCFLLGWLSMLLGTRKQTNV